MCRNVEPFQKGFSTLGRKYEVTIVASLVKKWWQINQGPVVQSFVSLTSLSVVKMLTVLVCTISNSQVFLLKKCE